MRSLRLTAIIAAFLIITVSIPQSLFSQTASKPSHPKQPAPRQLRHEQPRRADALTPAINELLDLDPLAPESPDEKSSEESASEDEYKPPADDAPIKELIAYWAAEDVDWVKTPKPSSKVRQRLLEACDEIEAASESKDESGAKTAASKAAIANDDVEVARDIGYRWEFQPGVLATVLYGNTVFRGNVNRWLPVISNLVGHIHRTVHRAAVKCLVKFLINESGDEQKQDIARKLVPWLTEPNWAAKEDRSEFIRCLTSLKMPELAPGLIWILDYDEDPDNRAAAAEALTQFRDPRAIPALRRALEKEKVEPNREKIVIALAECGALSDDEMAVAVEAYARMVSDEEGGREIDRIRNSRDPDKPLPLRVSIGRILNGSDTIKATEGLAIRLLERAKALRATQPAVAREILRVIEVAPLSQAEINLVERISEGWADVNSIAMALEYREAFRKSAGNELYGLIKQGGYAAGIAATILNDEREQRETLGGTDAKAQLALLAGARYLRDKLPVELAGKLLDSPNRALAKAAGSYLEVEDSPEARKLVLSRRPGEAYILGDLKAIGDDDEDVETARDGEDALRKELLGRNGPEAIYAVLHTYSPGNAYGVIIRVLGGKAEMSVYETEGRRNVRWLTDSEFEEVNRFTSRQEVEDLGPESYIGEEEEKPRKYEYLRLTKEGGRRIVLDALRRAPKNPTLHEELSGLFYRLSKSGEFTARYEIEDKIPGVEVVFADKNQSVLKICGEGSEVRALIEEKGAEYRQGGMKAAPEWREFSSGKLGVVKDEPSACRPLDVSSSALKNATVIRQSLFGQSSQPDGALFYAKNGENRGIWKVEPGMDPVEIASGNYNAPVITPDGNWLVAIKWVDDAGKSVQQLIRRNLKNGQEFVVRLPQNTLCNRLDYVAAHRKVLLLNLGFYGKVGLGSQSYLLDPETGTVQPVKGEFRPLTSDVSRAPQSAGAPNLFWVAICDREKRTTSFGQYDSKNFVFTLLLEFPELELSSDDIWVEAANGKIWIAYKGHLLRLPKPAQKK